MAGNGWPGKTGSKVMAFRDMGDFGSSLNLRSFSDNVLKRAFILSMAMNASHPDFVDTTKAGEIVWVDQEAEALFDLVLGEIARRVLERDEPFDIDGFEAIGGRPDEVLLIAPEGWQTPGTGRDTKPCVTVN